VFFISVAAENFKGFAAVENFKCSAASAAVENVGREISSDATDVEALIKSSSPSVFTEKIRENIR
jgi:hypothetical protein